MLKTKDEVLERLRDMLAGSFGVTMGKDRFTLRFGDDDDLIIVDCHIEDLSFPYHRKQDTERHDAEMKKPENQQSERFEDFSPAERTIAGGIVVVKKPGTEAPWLGPLGACLIKVFGIRRRNGRVEFGIGNEKPPILDWVTANAFFDEWPQ